MPDEEGDNDGPIGNEILRRVEAGIAIGDEIMAIDDKPANQFTSGQIEKLLMQDGTELSLTLRRAGKGRSVRIRLRRLI